MSSATLGVSSILVGMTYMCIFIILSRKAVDILFAGCLFTLITQFLCHQECCQEFTLIVCFNLPPGIPQIAATNAAIVHAWLMLCLLTRCPCILLPQMPPKLDDILDHTPSHDWLSYKPI